MSAAPMLKVGGQTLLLHPERAVEWVERRSVIVADTHFGKSAIFGSHGISVPAGSDDCDRDRLTRLLHRVGAERLIILGDFLHGPLAPRSPDAQDLERWSASLLPLRIHVVAGNHDRLVLRVWEPPVRWQSEDWIDGPFRFTHDAGRQTRESAQLFTLSGHVHPVVRLRGLRKHSSRVPAFWQREGGLVLPAFGLFTGGHAISPAPGERIYAVGPEKVVPFALQRPAARSVRRSGF